MSGSGLGAWWDPDADAPADGEVRREVRPARATGRRPPAGTTTPGRSRGDGARLQAATEAMSFETRPSRWWSVGMVAAAVAVLAAGLVAAVQLDLAWAVLAATATLPGALLLVAEGRQPRRVAALPDGLAVTGRRYAQELPWEQVRGARRRDLIGFPDVDTYLELGTGELVELPRGTPGGAVEAWRERVDGGRPESRLPQAWHATPEDSPQGPLQVLNLGNLLTLLLVNVVIRLADFSVAWLLAGYLVLGSAAFLALPLLPRGVITADHDGFTFRAWRRKHVPWSEVTDVRRKGRYDAEVVVELASGEQHELLGPDEDVVRGWWQLAVPDGPHSRLTPGGPRTTAPGR